MVKILLKWRTCNLDILGQYLLLYKSNANLDKDHVTFRYVACAITKTTEHKYARERIRERAGNIATMSVFVLLILLNKDIAIDAILGIE